MSPSSTADDTGDYATFGVEGLTLPGRPATVAVRDVCDRDHRDPARVVPGPGHGPAGGVREHQKLESLYPDIYSSDGGFYDAVNPSTGSVGHRRLVLDQSMIMASLDNALNGNALQRYFAEGPGLVGGAHLPVHGDDVAATDPAVAVDRRPAI